jgi:hypothetical protein
LSPFEDIEVVGLGQACADYLGRVPSYPREDGKMELLELRSQCGGLASTAPALKCKAVGARAGIPRLHEILHFLENHHGL